jgi:hypothetical protein
MMVKDWLILILSLLGFEYHFHVVCCVEVCVV